jgi:hypothetical protein
VAYTFHSLTGVLSTVLLVLPYHCLDYYQRRLTYGIVLIYLSNSATQTVSERSKIPLLQSDFLFRMSSLGRLQAKNLATVHARHNRAVEERKEQLLRKKGEWAQGTWRSGDQSYLDLVWNSRAIAQAVTRRLPTAEAWSRFQVKSCGICGRESGTGTGFLRVPRFPLPILIVLTAPDS